MKYLSLIFLVISVSCVFAQETLINKNGLQNENIYQYWVYKNIVREFPKYKRLKDKFKYPIDALALHKGKVYISDMSTENLWNVGYIDPTKKRNIIKMPDGDSIFQNKDFILEVYTDSLVLFANSKNKIDTLVFLKPNPYLKGQNLAHTIFSYRFIGNYKDNIKNDIKVSTDGELIGMESFKNWELDHLNAITEPKNKSWGGVIYFKSANQKKSYYLMNDYSNKSFSFYKYTRNKRGVYELFDKPEFIWFYD